MKRRDPERGSATVFGTVVIGVTMLIMFGLTTALVAASLRIETETAADAAALAAVVAAVEGRSPHNAAARAAVANGARLGRCACPAFAGRSFTATVLVTRAVRMPLFGELLIRSERSAEYAVGT